MNVTVCHSHQERCGVREYGLQLDKSFQALGCTVRPCTFPTLGGAVNEMSVGDILLVHYEPQLVGSDYGGLAAHLIAAHNRGAKTVFCCHWYEHVHMQWFTEHGFVDALVVHRDYGATHAQTVMIPLGCPVYESTESRAALRARFGLPERATVLTMIGFLVRWKLIPEIVEAALIAMADHPDLHLHVHTPWPFNTWEAQAETPRIESIIAHYPAGARAHFSTEFVPQQTVLDIAHASDLGLVFHPMHTGSVSAGTKPFVSARRPLVVTNSNHASDLLDGAHRVDTFDAGAVAREAVRVATSPELLGELQAGIVREYGRLNMDAIARRYIEVFEGLSR